MNEHNDLENELVALRPIEPSARLKERIANRLAEADRPHRSRVPLWLAVVVGPLAASFVLALLWQKPDPSQPPDQPGAANQLPVATAFDATMPTVWSYHSAVRQSPDELDRLLDQHAQRSLEPKPQRAGAFVSAFARSDAQLKNLLGEL